MSKNTNFEIGTIVTDTFLDSLQELLTGTIHNVRLSPGTSASQVALQLCGDIINDGRATVNIGGQYCFLDNTKDSLPASGAGTNKKVYLYTNATSSPLSPQFDITVAASPPAASYLRQVGLVDYSGSQLYNARMITGVQADHEQYNHFTFRSVYNTSNETILTVDGQSNQPSTAGVDYDSDISTSPTKALSVSSSGAEKLYIDTNGRVVFMDRSGGSEHAALQWADNDSSGGVDGVLTINTEFSSHLLGSGMPAFSTRVMALSPAVSDTKNRFTVYSSGEIWWGDGANTPDVSLSRTAANTLSLASGDKIQQAAVPTAGDDLTNKTYVDTSVGSVSSTAKRFSFFIGS